MSTAHGTSIAIVAYIVIFAIVGLIFLFVNLLIGRFVRPSAPTKQKSEIYECGEPAIGSSLVQFDLRFYVVALLFIIFDVEIAFFFPWATVFGKAIHMSDSRFEVVELADDGQVVLTRQAELLYREMGVREPGVPANVPATLRHAVPETHDAGRLAAWISKTSSRQLAWVTIVAICVFFAVLTVGFAYVWKRGDLDWVRAVARRHAGSRPAEPESPPASDRHAMPV
jgi:NADH-quinone oxidoreductase subunit A